MMASLVETLLKNVHGSEYNVEIKLEEIFEPSVEWNGAAAFLPAGYEIESVEKSSQPFLEAAFLLRRHEYSIRNATPASVQLLMHATAKTNVESILRENLDWRRVRRGKYGLGVSFTNDGAFVQSYGSTVKADGALIIADVLVQKTKITVKKTKMSTDWDTAVSNTNKVFVKYRDDEFYPRYVVRYTLTENRRAAFDSLNKMAKNILILINIQKYGRGCLEN